MVGEDQDDARARLAAAEPADEMIEDRIEIAHKQGVRDAVLRSLIEVKSAELPPRAPAMPQFRFPFPEQEFLLQTEGIIPRFEALPKSFFGQQTDGGKLSYAAGAPGACGFRWHGRRD